MPMQYLLINHRYAVVIIVLILSPWLPLSAISLVCSFFCPYSVLLWLCSVLLKTLEAIMSASGPDGPAKKVIEGKVAEAKEVSEVVRASSLIPQEPAVRL